MTREEAIEYFKMKVSAREAIGNDIGTDYEAYKIALTALHPVSREQVEKVWRGEWINVTNYTVMGLFYGICSKCHEQAIVGAFCNKCGAPMTDEAVQMVLERVEALHENIYNG